jgi:hypothetical protein
MREIVKADYPFTREEMPYTEASDPLDANGICF